jgi:hypothetical protein
LAPHAWLADGRSLYDCFGLGFALVVDAGADASDVERAARDAAALGVPLEIVRPEGLDVAQLFGARLALVRPDQHIAWRGDRWWNAFPVAVGAAMPNSA